MLHRFCGSDSKCHEIMADGCQSHSVCITAYTMTRRIHSQEKACPSTHTSPYDDVMDPVGITSRCTSLQRWCYIPSYSFLSDGFAKFLETHGVDNVHSY